MNQENAIVGIGYNRMPKGCDDDHLPWNCHGEGRWDTKYAYGELLRFSWGQMCTFYYSLLYHSKETLFKNKISVDLKFDFPPPYTPTPVCSAVAVAIMNKKCADLKGCTIYVTLFPCTESAKLIIEAGGWQTGRAMYAHKHTNTQIH